MIWKIRPYTRELNTAQVHEPCFWVQFDLLEFPHPGLPLSLCLSNHTLAQILCYNGGRASNGQPPDQQLGATARREHQCRLLEACVFGGWT